MMDSKQSKHLTWADDKMNMFSLEVQQMSTFSSSFGEEGEIEEKVTGFSTTRYSMKPLFEIPIPKQQEKDKQKDLNCESGEDSDDSRSGEDSDRSTSHSQSESEQKRNKVKEDESSDQMPMKRKKRGRLYKTPLPLNLLFNARRLGYEGDISDVLKELKNAPEFDKLVSYYQEKRGFISDLIFYESLLDERNIDSGLYFLKGAVSQKAHQIRLEHTDYARIMEEKVTSLSARFEKKKNGLDKLP